MCNYLYLVVSISSKYTYVVGTFQCRVYSSAKISTHRESAGFIVTQTEDLIKLYEQLYIETHKDHNKTRNVLFWPAYFDTF